MGTICVTVFILIALIPYFIWGSPRIELNITNCEGYYADGLCWDEGG
jgi:hypothetical protein